MVLLGVVLVIAALVAGIYAALEVLTTPPALVRTAPRVLWFPLVVLVPLLGPLAWFALGRAAAESDWVAVRSTSTAPDDDDAFLRGLRTRDERED